jgi:hypothetical protein
MLYRAFCRKRDTTEARLVFAFKMMKTSLCVMSECLCRAKLMTLGGQANRTDRRVGGDATNLTKGRGVVSTPISNHGSV